MGQWVGYFVQTAIQSVAVKKLTVIRRSRPTKEARRDRSEQVEN